MYVMYVFEDLGWKIESVHGSAEDAEFKRIERCLLDDRERDIKKLAMDIGTF